MWFISYHYDVLNMYMTLPFPAGEEQTASLVLYTYQLKEGWNLCQLL